jgi:transketolase
VSLGWHRWVGDAGRVLAIDRFGASAPAAVVFAELGLTAERVTVAAAELLDGRA